MLLIVVVRSQKFGETYMNEDSVSHVVQ